MMTASMVAMLGAIIASPFAAPLTVTLCPAIFRDRVTSLGKVSVVVHGRCRFPECVGRACQPASHCGNAVRQVLSGRIASNDAGRAHQHVFLRTTKRAGRLVPSSSERLRPPFAPVQVLALPELVDRRRRAVLHGERTTVHRRTADEIRGKHADHRRRPLGYEEGQIQLRGVLFDAAMDAGGL